MAFSIAIDGPAASGKGTISKAVAEHFGFAHLDTGLLYRAVGVRILQGVSAIEAAQCLMAKDLEGEALRLPAVAQAASRAATIPEVREALVDFQRAFARRDGGAVLDGRDIGTVICPDAEVKLFVIATDEVRAQRRFAELSAKGMNVSIEDVLADLRERDARDSQRATAPLTAASDAVVLDTTDMTIAQATQKAIKVISQKRNQSIGH